MPGPLSDSRTEIFNVYYKKFYSAKRRLTELQGLLCEITGCN